MEEEEEEEEITCSFRNRCCLHYRLLHEGHDVVTAAAAVLVLPHRTEGVPAEVEPQGVTTEQGSAHVVPVAAASGVASVLLHDDPVRPLVVVEAEDEEVLLVLTDEAARVHLAADAERGLRAGEGGRPRPQGGRGLAVAVAPPLLVLLHPLLTGWFRGIGC